MSKTDIQDINIPTNKLDNEFVIKLDNDSDSSGSDSDMTSDSSGSDSDMTSDSSGSDSDMTSDSYDSDSDMTSDSSDSDSSSTTSSSGSSSSSSSDDSLNDKKNHIIKIPIKGGKKTHKIILNKNKTKRRVIKIYI